jgi:hypothetical protein
MQDYNEKRNYPRMTIECPANFRIVGGAGGGAIVKNLSGGGVLMSIDHEIAEGSEMRIEIKPVNDITPPMVAEVRVLRCTPGADPEEDYSVACQINRLLG